MRRVFFSLSGTPLGAVRGNSHQNKCKYRDREQSRLLPISSTSLAFVASDCFSCLASCRLGADHWISTSSGGGGGSIDRSISSLVWLYTSVALVLVLFEKLRVSFKFLNLEQTVPPANPVHRCSFTKAPMFHTTNHTYICAWKRCTANNLTSTGMTIKNKYCFKLIFISTPWQKTIYSIIVDTVFQYITQNCILKTGTTSTPVNQQFVTSVRLTDINSRY